METKSNGNGKGSKANSATPEDRDEPGILDGTETAGGDASGDEIIEPPFSESIAVFPEFKLPVIRNPHPKLSAATWIVLAAAVLIGSFAYFGFLSRILNERTGAPVSVNGVNIPAELAGYPLHFGSIRDFAGPAVLADSPPDYGILIGVIYGNPYAGNGLVLNTKPAVEDEKIESYARRVLGMLDIQSPESSDKAGENDTPDDLIPGGIVYFKGTRASGNLRHASAAAFESGGRFWLLVKFSAPEGLPYAIEQLDTAARETVATG